MLLLVSRTHSPMENDQVEYLTEWPPNPPKEGSTADIKQEDENACVGEQHWVEESLDQPISAKRPRLCVHDTGVAGEDLEQKERSLTQSDPSLLAGTLLAQWWKMQCRYGAVQETLEGVTDSTNPNTQLFHIARLPRAKKFLERRVEYLKETYSPESNSVDSSTLHTSLASCYQKLGDCEKALEQARLVLEADAGDKEARWTYELLSRQKIVADKICKAKVKLQEKTCCLSIPEPVQVEKRHADNLTFSEFFFQYALTHTPVVITGLVGHMTPTPWTLDYIKTFIGHRRAPLKQMVPGSVEWARLELAGESTVAEFIDSLDHQGDALKYLFDWSLPLNCPELVKELQIPKYFASDFLQRTPPGSLYCDSWPSLFIAPVGITSELHVDAFGSNFWMALFEGRKRWMFFPPEDIPYLYPLYNHSTDAVFEVSLGNPDLHLHPLLCLTHPRECILQPGEVLFVPAGCPHRVENLEKSLAISANFVDLSNFEAVCKELKVNALVDERAEQLLKIFESKEFSCEVDEQQQILPWKEFKTWPRTVQTSLKLPPSTNEKVI